MDVQKIKQTYPAGTRILVIHMDDPWHPVPDNTRGTVALVDDIGDIHCVYDGFRSGLAVVPETDQFRKLTETELQEENLAKNSKQ